MRLQETINVRQLVGVHRKTFLEVQLEHPLLLLGVRRQRTQIVVRGIDIWDLLALRQTLFVVECLV